VARVGSITRLDSIGIATATAVRGDPVGESVSVSTGKGTTELHAQVGALAEALERYCAEPRGRIPVRPATRESLDGESLAPESFILPRGVTAAGVIDWVRGRGLDGRDLWIPANAVFFPYYPSIGAERLFAANTTGLAVGANVEEALVFALLECIERDAYSRAVALASVGHGDSVPVVRMELAGLVAPEIQEIRSRGHEILIRDISCDTHVPCYLCTIYDGVLAHLGVSARPDGGQALRAAVQEAAQSRLTDIQGAREDLADRNSSTPVDPWFLTVGNAQLVSVRSGWQPPALVPSEVLSGLTTRLQKLTPPVYSAWVDLTLPGVGLTTVRTAAPGLEVWALDPSRIGPRARRWLCQARW
jgi:thioglycine synthase